MGRYIEPILTACIAFPFVAAIFTMPFIIHHYRRYGGIAVMRVLVVYSFILYSMCAFLLTVLPLPTREAVAASTPRPIGWIPRDLVVGMRKAGLLFSDPSTLLNGSAWIKFLKSSDLFQIIANIVMLVPLGFYLRYYFRCGLGKTILIGFCVSLFYELTQLSGLFFIYPKPYRYTEVDDLINNTLGAAIGYGITPMLCAILPSRDEIDRISYEKGRQVTIIRRLFAAVLDMAIRLAISLGLYFIISSVGWGISDFFSEPLMFALYFVLIPYLMSGRTPGQALLKLKTVDELGKRRPNVAQLFIRNVMIYSLFPLLVLFDLVCLAAMLFAVATPDTPLLLMILIIGFGAAVLFFTIWIFYSSYQRWGCMPHSHFSQTRVVAVDQINEKG